MDQQLRPSTSVIPRSDFAVVASITRSGEAGISRISASDPGGDVPRRYAAAAPDPTTAPDACSRPVPTDFAALPAAERGRLAAAQRAESHASTRAGEAIVREGDAGSSVFSVMAPRRVGGDRRIRRLTKWLVSDRRRLRLPGDVAADGRAPWNGIGATAVTDVEVLEITVDAFRQFALATSGGRRNQIGSAAVADRAVARLEALSTGAGAAVPAGD